MIERFLLVIENILNDRHGSKFQTKVVFIFWKNVDTRIAFALLRGIRPQRHQIFLSAWSGFIQLQNCAPAKGEQAMLVDGKLRIVAESLKREKTLARCIKKNEPWKKPV